MNLYQTLKLIPVRTEPSVWISRLVIFERFLPEPVIIRDIPLERGINIVWAKEPDVDGSSTEITGHSAGKTTFCRFLRYVLGEHTFGTRTNMSLIRGTFPDGHVAAELHVMGKQWAVRRPIGSGRMSYAKENATIEELLQDRGSPISQDDYPTKLGLDRILDALETATVVRTDETIHWGHVLAWCSRDQEARFQSIHDWRSPRSESGAPNFQRPREGPLFVMRAVMGLFLSEELKGEEKLAELQRKREKLEKEMEEKRREPQFRVNLYGQELQKQLSAHLPQEPGIETMPLHSNDLLQLDLYRLTDKATSSIEKTIQLREGKISELQAQIDEIGARIEQKASELAQLDSLFELDDAAGTELENGILSRQDQRAQLHEYQDNICPFGDVIVRDCSYVVARQKTLRLAEHQDARFMQQAEAARAAEQKKIEESRGRLQSAIESLKKQRIECQVRRKSIEKELMEGRGNVHALRQAREELVIWSQRHDQGIGYEELASLRQQLEDTNRNIEKLDSELTDLLKQHNANRERLAEIFSGAVRSVLSSKGYDGTVNFENRELAFRITHGPAMSGEAVETLSVLLADVSSLVYHTVSDRAHLPGFLLHDSPREADLGLLIYWSFIRFVASLQEHFGAAEMCPFQYILTTTTAPPQELQASESIKLRLNAAKLDELLLRKNVASLPQDTEMFS